MYHAITDQPVAPSVHGVHVSDMQFSEQMEWMASQGYRSLSVTQLLDGLRQGNLPAKCFVLTFDDGYYSLLKSASPVLERYGFTATLFLTTASVGHPDFSVLPEYDTSYPPSDRPLTWSELTVLKEKGWDIQAHGHHHIANNMIPATFLFHEMEESIHEIEQHLGGKVQYYAYPYGRYSTTSLNMLQKANLVAAFSVHPGLVSRGADKRRLPRVEVNRHDSIESFKRKIATGYGSDKQKFKTRLLLATLYRNTRVKDIIKGIWDRLKHNKRKPRLH